MKITTMAGCFLLLAAITASPALAQSQPPPPPPPNPTLAVTNENRLFQRFVEDGAVTDNVWVEGQFRFLDFDHGNAIAIGPTLAVNVAEDIELGGRIDLLSVNPDPGSSDTGFSDLDVYGKVRLSTRPTQTALGVLLKFPTGDNDKGLGTGETDVEFFGGLRHDFDRMSIVGNAGLRINQDPTIRGLQLEGETSLLLGGGFLWTIMQNLVGVAEATFETERINNAGSDFRLTFGADYTVDEGFHTRGAIAVGSGDSAPNFELIGSAVFLF